MNSIQAVNQSNGLANKSFSEFASIAIFSADPVNNPHSVFAEGILSITPAEKCTLLWQVVKSQIESYFLGKCEDNLCLIGNKYTAKFTPSDEGCKVSFGGLDSVERADIQIEGDMHRFFLSDEGARLSMQTNFQDHAAADWEYKESKYVREEIKRENPIFPEYEWVLREETKNGSFKIEKVSREEGVSVNIQLALNGVKMEGKCTTAGSNELVCEAVEASALAKLLGANKIKATYTTETNEAGDKIETVELFSPSSLPFVSAHSLGRIQITENSKTGVFTAVGDGPFFNGKIGCASSSEPKEDENGLFLDFNNSYRQMCEYDLQTFLPTQFGEWSLKGNYTNEFSHKEGAFRAFSSWFSSLVGDPEETIHFEGRGSIASVPNHHKADLSVVHKPSGATVVSGEMERSESDTHQKFQVRVALPGDTEFEAKGKLAKSIPFDELDLDIPWFYRRKQKNPS